jgi:hypothetical protein
MRSRLTLCGTARNSRFSHHASSRVQPCPYVQKKKSPVGHVAQTLLLHALAENLSYFPEDS